MSKLCLITRSARTATIVVAPEGARFTLPAPVGWRLERPGGNPLASGETTVAPLFLEGLDPATEYRLVTVLGTLHFRTAPCAGLVSLADHGGSPEAEDNSDAFARALAAVPEGGTLLVPPGRHVIRPVFLKPGMTLYLPEGAELSAAHDRRGWPVLPAHDAEGRVCGTWEGLPEPSFAAPLTAIGCDGLAITGRGIIDGGGDRGDWWSWPKETRDGARRPRTLFLAHSRDLSLSGLTIRNSPSWTVHPYRCDGFTAAALTIENPPDSPNTDGLNPESCEGVTLTGLFFSVGDDCIAVKAGKRAPGSTGHLAPTTGLEITHCRMARGHGAVVLGSEMSGDITDVEIADCEFDGTDRGLRIKTRRGRGGRVARVTLRDTAMRDVATPFSVNAFYFCDPDGHSAAVQSRAPAPIDETTPRIEDITVARLHGTGVRHAAAALLGLPEAPIRGVRLDDFCVSFDPDAAPGVPLMADGVAAMRHAGLVAEHAEVTGEIRIDETQTETAPC